MLSDLKARLATLIEGARKEFNTSRTWIVSYSRITVRGNDPVSSPDKLTHTIENVSIGNLDREFKAYIQRQLIIDFQTDANIRSVFVEYSATSTDGIGAYKGSFNKYTRS